MSQRILYCGDDRLTDAARYLGGVLKKGGFSYDHLPSDTPFRPSLNRRRYRLYILSDYPSARFSVSQLRTLAKNISDGASLLMIGGWGSFKGVDGNYHNTPLTEVLPVRCSRTDDRVQGAVSYRVIKNTIGGDFRRLPFETSPGIAGYNKVSVKREAREVLSVATIGYQPRSRKYQTLRQDPLLVFGTYGAGRVAALTTDLAPHWAGGFVDWGKTRIRIRLTPKVSIEIGEQYLKFVNELIDLLL